jgi:hypothetical protein
MEIKRETVRIIGKNYKGKGNSIKMEVHWSKSNGEYVLCIPRLFGWIHFTIEECEDMIKILKRYN